MYQIKSNKNKSKSPQRKKKGFTLVKKFVSQDREEFSGYSQEISSQNESINP